MSLIITGRGVRRGELPVGQAEALAYFRDVKAFVAKIQEVERIEEGPQGSLLVSHRPIGGMNYFVTVVYAMTCDWHEQGVRFGSAPFDLSGMRSPHQLVKGEVSGHLHTQALPNGHTATELDFTLSVALPVPFALKLVPSAVLKTTADGIMSLKVGISVEDMYRKVEEDFGLR